MTSSQPIEQLVPFELLDSNLSGRCIDMFHVELSTSSGGPRHFIGLVDVFDQPTFRCTGLWLTNPLELQSTV